MSSVKCPHCQMLIQLPHAGAGTIQCPKCRNAISFGTGQAGTSGAQPAGGFHSTMRQPQHSPPAKQHNQATGWLLLLGGIFAGLLLCGGICAGGVFWVIRSAKAVDQRFVGKDLLEGRAGHQTQLSMAIENDEPPETPPAELFSLVQYPAENGPTPAYLGVGAADNGAKHPAMIWIFGGFSNGIGSTAWEPADRDNDQSARAFREAGIVMMYPALRGGSGAPGVMEGMYGEVNDVLRAADFLAQQPGIDPNRIYLGGHSTGGSLALLCAAASHQKFRAVFALGPVDRLSGYGQESLPYDVGDETECVLRDPIEWLHAIEVSTFAIEGSEGNAACLFMMDLKSDNGNFQTHIVQNADHFNVIAPVTELLAKKVMADNAQECQIDLTTAELNAAVQ